ncbi:MAG: FliH/SctL family protein [Anaeromyxobacteraceae bacterium]
MPVLSQDPRFTRVLSAGAHEALRKAHETVRTARAESAAIREAARLEGLAQGRAEAAAVLATASMARDRLLAGAGPELVALALLVARKILAEEPRTPPERAAALAAQVLAEVRERRGVTVRAHPGDVARVRAAIPEEIPVEPDAQVEPGGCALETPAGRIEAGLDAQLEELARALGAAPGYGSGADPVAGEDAP